MHIKIYISKSIFFTQPAKRLRPQPHPNEEHFGDIDLFYRREHIYHEFQQGHHQTNQLSRNEICRSDRGHGVAGRLPRRRVGDHIRDRRLWCADPCRQLCDIGRCPYGQPIIVDGLFSQLCGWY